MTDQSRFSLLSLAAASTLPLLVSLSAPAQSDDTLLNVVKSAITQYRDVSTAIAAGYEPLTCVSGRDGGAMGIHYVNGSLLFDGMLDPVQPEILVYEPKPSGRMELVAAEYLTFYDSWHEVNGADVAPTLAGHQLNYTGAPNRYALPAHYELHVWAMKRNPMGSFADWNPTVTCEHY